MTRMSYEELTFTNSFIFSKVMTNNPEICKELTEAILGTKIKEIVKSPDREFPIEITEDGKGVRFDVVFEGDDSIYDIEMQSYMDMDLPKRSRYYQSMSDLRQLEKGAAYSEIKKSYIIFICTFDPFGEGLPKYTFTNVCKEKNDLQLGDDAIKIFINSKGIASGETPRLKELLKYIEDGKANGSLTRMIEDEVKIARMNKNWRTQYMTYQQEIEYAAYRAAKKARETALEEGRLEGKIETIKRFTEILSPEEILKLGFTKEDVEAAQK